MHTGHIDNCILVQLRRLFTTRIAEVLPKHLDRLSVQRSRCNTWYMICNCLQAVPLINSDQQSLLANDAYHLSYERRL